MRLACALSLVLASSSAWCAVYPPLHQGMDLPSLEVFDEAGNITTLRSELSDVSGPVLLLPGYTTCRTACPVMVSSLQASLSELGQGLADLTPVFLSFAGAKTSEDLTEYRVRHALASSWKLLATTAADDARNFLDEFSYKIMSSGSEYVHPNQVIVLDSDLRWIASIYATDLTDKAISAEDLTRAIGGAKSYRSFVHRVWSSVRSPQNILFMGIAGLVVAIASGAVVFLRGWWRG